jgi:hypothetical protein
LAVRPDIAAGAAVWPADLDVGRGLDTVLRAIGRGFGNGIFGAAQAATVTADNTNARLVAMAVDRSAAARR